MARRRFKNMVEGIVVLTGERALVLGGIKSLQIEMDPRLEISGLDVSLHASHKAEADFPHQPDLSLLATAIKEFWSRSLSLREKPSRAERARPARKPSKKATSRRTIR
jgi:hypothetical protein